MTLGKAYNSVTSSILDLVAASQTQGSQPKSDSDGENKALPTASEEKELPW